MNLPRSDFRGRSILILELNSLAKNLKKFVNPTFTRTVPLDQLRRLLERHRNELVDFDLDIFDGEPDIARRAMESFFARAEGDYPPRLIGDLHRIAELGDHAGFELICQQARRFAVTMPSPASGPSRDDPKHLALWAFLDAQEVFETAIILVTYFRKTGVAEFAGQETGAEAQLDEEALKAFETSVMQVFEADRLGGFCEVSWHEDDGEIVLVVTHCAPFTSIPIIEEGRERVITVQGSVYAHLSYSSVEGRLKILGVPKARHADVAERFAAFLLGRPGFFAGPQAQRLYTLASVERQWPAFKVTHLFDPAIRHVRIIEAQVEQRTLDLFGEPGKAEGSIIARDSQNCALKRLHEMCPTIEFSSGVWRLAQIVLRVQIETGTSRRASVTVKLRPAAAATFKRQRFEGQIMELLRRNGFCHARIADQSAVAAE